MTQPAELPLKLSLHSGTPWNRPQTPNIPSQNPKRSPYRTHVILPLALALIEQRSNSPPPPKRLSQAETLKPKLNP